MNKGIKDKPVLVLNVRAPGRSGWADPEGFFHVEASVGRLVDERPDDAHNRSCGLAFITPEIVAGFRVRDLVYTGQGDRRSADLYSGSARYSQVYAAELFELEAMVKCLRLLSRRMTDMATKFGYAPDFVEQVMRFGHALGAERVFYRLADTRGGSGASTHGADAWEWRACEGVNPLTVDEQERDIRSFLTECHKSRPLGK